MEYDLGGTKGAVNVSEGKHTRWEKEITIDSVLGDEILDTKLVINQN